MKSITPEPIPDYGATAQRKLEYGTLAVINYDMSKVTSFCQSNLEGKILVAVGKAGAESVADRLKEVIPSNWRGTLDLQIPKSFSTTNRAMLKAKMAWRFFSRPWKLRFSEAPEE